MCAATSSSTRTSTHAEALSVARTEPDAMRPLSTPMARFLDESQALSAPPILRIGTAAHPNEYCRSAPPLNAMPCTPVMLRLPCSRVNEEVPDGEKDQGQGGPEAEVGERAFAERDRPHRPRLEAQSRTYWRPRGSGASPGRTSRGCPRNRPTRCCSPAGATPGRCTPARTGRAPTARS